MTWRSWLFVPGDSPRKLEKAVGSGADALILDLEDAVAPADKPAARAEVARALQAPAPMARFVRVNALDTGLTRDDIAATLAPGLAGYVLPKCEGPDDVSRLCRMVADLGGRDDLPVLAIATETVRAVRRLMRENWRHPRLCGLAWGGEDLAADLGAARNRGEDGAYLGPFRMARELTLLAAAEAGVAAIDAVFTDFQNPAALAGETRAGAVLGFAGKMAIHPAQIPVIHEALRPEPGEIIRARKIIAAMAAAGDGVARLDGQMLDRPHLRQAERLLARAGESQG